MLLNIPTAALLLASALQAVAEPAPYKLGSISLNTAFGLGKRQSGYAPTQTFCGVGDTCAESCGAEYVQCASNDGDLHCFDPTINETCCPDGTGNSCSDGYYCTKDNTGETWCCPNGLSLTDCAAAYSLTGVLFSEASTAAPTVSAATQPATQPASVSVTSTALPSSTKEAQSASTSAAKTSVVQFNGTATTTSGPVQVTGGANTKAALGGWPALLLAGGALFL